MGVYNKYLKKIDKKQKSKTQHKMPETRVPMTLRDHFLQDSFFKSAWEDMETMRSKFFQTSNSMKMLDHENNNSVSKSEEDGWMLPRKWMMSSFLDDKMFSNDDSGVINIKEDETKMGISLNTSGYSPSELTVNVKDDVLVIEGKHEEKSESGHTMVSRQFRREYGLDSQSKLTEVVSNLSQDGVLVITVPKEKRIQELKEENKMKMERRKSVEKKEESKSVQQINVENRSGASTQSAENRNKTTSLVPMNLRESFFDDPFFKDNWLDIQQSQKDFFSKAEERFSQQMEMLKSSFDQDFGFSSIGSFNKEMVELSLATAGSKPDELKVTAG